MDYNREHGEHEGHGEGEHGEWKKYNTNIHAWPMEVSVHHLGAPATDGLLG